MAAGMRGGAQLEIEGVGVLINGVVTSKLQHLDEVLGPVTLERFQSEWVIRRAVERDLQVAVEVIVDVSHRVIAIKGAVPPATSRAALQACEQLGMLANAERCTNTSRFAWRSWCRS